MASLRLCSGSLSHNIRTLDARLNFLLQKRFEILLVRPHHVMHGLCFLLLLISSSYTLS